MIDTAEDVENRLRECYEWLVYVHSTADSLSKALKLSKPAIPDQVESIKIIHLAASIAALESEC